MSIGGLPALNDGNNARAILYDRLIEKYNVQMFISAGNSGPGMNTIGDPSVATKVMSVGAYIHKETWLSQLRRRSATRTTACSSSPRAARVRTAASSRTSSRPGAAVSTVPTWQTGQPGRAARYVCPPGYAMFNGTSMASPQAAGAAALLISAAKQTGVAVPARPAPPGDQLERSLPRRFYGAHEQGNGLHQRRRRVGPAEDEHQDGRRSRRSAPVNTILSELPRDSQRRLRASTNVRAGSPASTGTPHVSR